MALCQRKIIFPFLISRIPGFQRNFFLCIQFPARDCLRSGLLITSVRRALHAVQRNPVVFYGNRNYVLAQSFIIRSAKLLPMLILDHHTAHREDPAACNVLPDIALSRFSIDEIRPHKAKGLDIKAFPGRNRFSRSRLQVHHGHGFGFIQGILLLPGRQAPIRRDHAAFRADAGIERLIFQSIQIHPDNEPPRYR